MINILYSTYIPIWYIWFSKAAGLVLFSILWTGHLRRVQILFCPVSLLIPPDSSNYSAEGQQHQSINRKCPCFAFANTSWLCCVSFWLVLLWFGRKKPWHSQTNQCNYIGRKQIPCVSVFPHSDWETELPANYRVLPSEQQNINVCFFIWTAVNNEPSLYTFTSHCTFTFHWLL